MNVFTNTKKSKKIFIILVLLILFNFTCPKIVRAGDTLDWIMVGVGKLFFGLFDGIQSVVDRLFLDETHEGLYTVSAENVIKGKFILINPNIFEKITSNDKNYYDYDSTITGRNTLRDTISGWYYALRNLAIIALLSILVYVAIRMILSTVSQDKAKYKMMFKDWLVALCLLFLIHYIMVGILNLSSTITNAIGTSSDSLTQSLAIEIDNKIDEAVKETRANGTDDDYVVETMLAAMADTVIYAAMVIMNVIFIAKYVIRALTIIFLVLLAPITCITYPIDKISDGKAQAYDMWFKEFLYQVIIQPFHLLIYVVLIGSAAELASENLIYAMLCFGVMIPAEKFIKQMFGFKDKLGSPLGDLAPFAAAKDLMRSIGSGKRPNGGSSGKDKGSAKEDDIPRTPSDLELPGSSDSGYNLPEDSDPVDPDSIDTDPVNPDSVDPDSVDPDSVDTDPVDPDSVDTDPVDTDSVDTETDENETQTMYNTNTEKPGMAKRMLNGAGNIAKKTRNVIDGKTGKHFMRKYGSTSVKKIAGRMAKNVGKKALGSVYSTGKNVGRRVVRGAVTLAGGLAFGAFGAMFEKGKEGMAIGTQFGSKIGDGLTNVTDKVWEKVEGGVQSVKDTASDVYNKFGNHKEEKDKKEHHMKEANIKQGSKNYEVRHGVEASPAELEKELDKMYIMESYNIDKNNYNSVLKQAEKYQDEEGMSEDDAMKTAMSSALQAQQYSAKDMKDEKTMNAAYKELYEQYEGDIVNGRITKEQADENVRRILYGAAQMKGVKKPPISSVSGKEKFMSNKDNKEKYNNTYAQRHSGRKPNAQQLNHELEMAYKLKRART